MDGDYTPERVNLNELVVPVDAAVILPSEDPITNHWYNDWDAATHDFQVGAQKAADATGHVQRIHRHKHTDECDGHEHVDVYPDPRRRAALTR